jgi:hypothetical protein
VGDAFSLIFQATFSSASLGILAVLALAISIVAVWNGSQRGLQISLALVHGLVLPMFLAFCAYRQNEPAWSWWLNRGFLSPPSVMVLQILNVVLYSLLCTVFLVLVYITTSSILQRPWEIAVPFHLLKASAATCIPVFIGMAMSGATGRADYFRNTTIAVLVLLPVLHSLAQGSDFQNVCQIFPNLLVNYREQKETIYAWFLGSMLVAYLSSYKIR